MNIELKTIGEELQSLLTSELTCIMGDLAETDKESISLAAKCVQRLTVKAVKGVDIKEEIVQLKAVILNFSSAYQAIVSRTITDLIEKVLSTIATQIAARILM